MKQNTVDLWNIFNKKMDAAGYTVSVTQDIPGMPDGSTCFINKDKWIPIIKLCIFGNDISIHVENRCGNSILNGTTVAIYKLTTKEAENLEKMMNYTIEKWNNYNKSNPYIFTSGEDEIERKDF